MMGTRGRTAGAAILAGSLAVTVACSKGSSTTECHDVADRSGHVERQCKTFAADKRAIAAALLQKLVNDAYPEWLMNHPSQPCPSSLHELADAIGLDSKDPWGRELHVGCGASLPPSAGKDGLAVWSDGPDGTPDTADDVKSWDPK